MSSQSSTSSLINYISCGQPPRKTNYMVTLFYKNNKQEDLSVEPKSFLFYDTLAKELKVTKIRKSVVEMQYSKLSDNLLLNENYLDLISLTRIEILQTIFKKCNIHIRLSEGDLVENIDDIYIPETPPPQENNVVIESKVEDLIEPKVEPLSPEVEEKPHFVKNPFAFIKKKGN